MGMGRVFSRPVRPERSVFLKNHCREQTDKASEIDRQGSSFKFQFQSSLLHTKELHAREEFYIEFNCSYQYLGKRNVCRLVKAQYQIKFSCSAHLLPPVLGCSALLLCSDTGTLPGLGAD